MNDAPAMERPWWRMNPLAWFALLLLAGLSIGLSTGLISFRPRTILQFVYWLDPRTWPFWLVYPLWSMVCWRLVDLPHWSEFDRKLGGWLKPAILIACILVVVWQNGWYTQTARRYFFTRIYGPYIIGPMSQYIADGSWSWRIFILPVMGAVALTWLIGLMIRLRRKEKNQHREST